MMISSYIKNKIENTNTSVKASVAYIFVSLVTKGLAFITLPIFTRLMSTSEIGLVSIFYSWFSIWSEILSLGMLSGGFNAAMSKYKEYHNQYCSSILSLILLITLIFCAFLLPLKNCFLKIASLTEPLFYLMIIGLFLTPATNIWLIKNRYEYNYKIVCLISVIQAISATLFSLLAVVISANYGIGSLGEIRLFSQNIVQFGFAIIFLVVIFKNGKVIYKREYWLFSLSMGLPLVVHQIAGEILSTSDRIMLGNILNNSAVGIYTTLFSLCSLGSIIWNGINSAFVPVLYENITDEEKHAKISSFCSASLIVFGMFTILIVLCAPEIVFVMATSEYISYIALVPFFAISVFCTSVSNVYSNLIIYYQKAKYIMISTLIAAGINIILNYFFIKIIGSYGAAIATCISYILMISIQVMVVHKIYKSNAALKMPYNERRICEIFCAIVLLSVISFLLYQNALIRYLAIALLLVTIVINKNRILSLFKKL